MKKASQPKKFTGAILFVVGILLGALLLGGLVWSDFEVMFYGLPQLTNNRLAGFSCPPLMTRNETASLRATIRNETDRPIAPVVRVEISTAGLPQSERSKVPLEPGESINLTWPISSQNIDLNWFVFAKVYRYPAYQTKLAEATCGILVVNVPFLKGGALLALWLGASLICTLTGLWMLEPRHVVPNQKVSIAMLRRILALAMLIGLIFGLQGLWGPGVFALVVIISLMTSMLFLFLAEN
jgi:hypothetical protein